MPKLQTYVLENEFARACFLNYGATLHTFELLINGEWVNQVLSCDDINDYIGNGIYLNAICGPTSGRIANATYELNGTVELSKNDGENHLHGGADAYARKYFDCELDGSTLICSFTTDNVEYPGIQQIKITYELMGTDLHITFEADTDTDIPMNLTSHIYFGAFENDYVLENEMKLDSDKRFRLVNAIPDGIVEDDRYLSFNKVVKWDDPFVLNGGSPAVIYKSKKQQLTVDTDYDCVVIYTQNFASPEVDGVQKGICFETQKYPNGINIKGYNAVLKAGEHYKHKTIYKFGVVDNDSN